MTRARARLLSAAAVFLLAMAVRVLFLYSTSDRGWPHSALYEGDAPVWVRWAQALDRGEAFEFDLPMRTPGVAYALHGLVPGLLAAPFTLLKLVWCAVSATTCAMLFAIVQREIGTRVAWIAAMLLCFAFGSYELATSLNNEAPYAFLIVLLIGATLRWIEAPRPVLAGAIGVLHGMAMLLRAEHALILAGFLVYAALATRSWRAARSLALVAAAAVLVCLPWSLRSHAAVVRFNTIDPAPIDFEHADPPWTIEAADALRALPAFARAGNFAYFQSLNRTRNKKLVDRVDVVSFFRDTFGYVPEPLSAWTLVSSKGALDFALANHPASDGGFSRAALQDGLDADAAWAFGRPSHLRLYNHGYDVGWQWIRADFGSWMTLVRRKLERFWEGVTLGFTAYDLPHGRANHRAPVDLATPVENNSAWSIAVAITILAGIALSWRRNFAALCLIVIAGKLAVTIVYYGYARQAVSIEPVFFVFAAVAIDSLLAKLHCPPRAALLLGAAILLALLACDIFAFRGSHGFDIRPKSPEARIVRVPEWGLGAFETVDEIEILPR
ncbi:MAG: glycosyltransferase family 39 protein [Planctomycetota bacterium]